jgi:hypothetical protein
MNDGGNRVALCVTIELLIYIVHVFLEEEVETRLGSN